LFARVENRKLETKTAARKTRVRPPIVIRPARRSRTKNEKRTLRKNACQSVPRRFSFTETVLPVFGKIRFFRLPRKLVNRKGIRLAAYIGYQRYRRPSVLIERTNLSVARSDEMTRTNVRGRRTDFADHSSSCDDLRSTAAI